MSHSTGTDAASKVIGRRASSAVMRAQQPAHSALVPVATHDFEGFYRQEVDQREALGYPPFGRLTRIVVHAEEEEHARQGIEAVARAARAMIPDGTALELMGPSPAPIARLRGRYRFMCLLKGTDEAALARASKAALAVGRGLPRDVQMALDARPVNML